MFFVVYYHIQAISIGLPVNQSVLATALLSFRMPDFFFVSGFLSYKSLEYWNRQLLEGQLKSKIQQLIIPLITLYALWALFLRQANPIPYFLNNGFEGFWFTFVLFGFQLTYFTLSILCHSVGVKIGSRLFTICAIIAGILGVGILLVFQNDGLWWRSLCLTPYFRYLQFFMFGLLCRKYSARFFKLLNKDWFVSSLMIIFIACIYLIFSSDNIKAEYGMIGNLINDIIVRYAALLIVVICFYKKRNYFEKDNIITRVMSLIGRRSLDIYMIHNFLLPHLNTLSPWLQDKYNFVLEFWLLFVITALIIAFALMIGGILRNSKFLGICLLGVKPAKKA